jgi:hypothetical protein
MARKKKRIEIPPELAAQVLFISDRTCCVCRAKGKPVQIHHIDDDTSHNNFANLSVLCLDCHRETQIRGGFDRKLDAEQVLLYRDDWLRIVATDRAASEARQEVDHEQSSLDIGLITSIAEIYRENKQYELLAVHYNAIGNIELRDKYVERALKNDTSDAAVFYLRATLQKRPDLVPKEVIDRCLAKYDDIDSPEQYARALFAVGRRLDAAVKYIEGINDSLQDGNWFGAAYYLREFSERRLIEELLKAAHRKATDDGSLWWQVRALQELGWHSELKQLLLGRKEEIHASDNILLMELLAEAEGDLDQVRELRKQIAKASAIARAEQDGDEDA